MKFQSFFRRKMRSQSITLLTLAIYLESLVDKPFQSYNFQLFPFFSRFDLFSSQLLCCFLLLLSFLFKIVVVSFLIYLHIRRAYFHMCLTTTENRHPFREWLSLCTLLTYGSLYVRSLPILWMCVQGFRDVFMNKSNYSRPVFRKYAYTTL